MKFSEKHSWLRMAAEVTRASYALEEVLLTLEQEFAELEQEYGSADLQQHSMVEDPGSSSIISEVESDQDEPSFTPSESVEVEASDSDLQEDSRVHKFLTDTCKCHLGVVNKPCCLTLSTDAIRKCRQLCFELSHNELDLVIMAQVHYFRTVLGATRSVSSYYFHGVKLCQATFLFLHCISHNRYLRVSELYTKEGLTVSKHGNSGRVPKHTCTFEQINAVKTFIENYASAHGLPVPGRLANTKDKVLLLPSDMSKMFVFRKYDEASVHPVRKSKFLELWSQLTPYVAVMKPASDLVSTIPPVSTVTQTATPAASDRGKRKCSVCHKIGHTKRTCKGINRS